MKANPVLAGIIGVSLAAGLWAAPPNAAPVPTQMVITVRRAPGDDRPINLQPGDVTLLHANTPVRLLRLDRLTGDLADMQLFILMDDSTRTTSLGLQLPELKSFIESLPASTEVGVGYMNHGTFGMVQTFTADHQRAAKALRLPTAIPGENGSPYFALSDLAKHWPSKQLTGRRVVLMLTDGIDRYYSQSDLDDPYVNASIHDALKEGVMVYSIYLRGAGLYGRSGWVTNFAQSRLIEVSDQTGGTAYFQGLSDPVNISPFLKDLRERLDNQYRVTVEALNDKGVQPVKVHAELTGVKIEGPTKIYVR